MAEKWSKIVIPNIKKNINFECFLFPRFLWKTKFAPQDFESVSPLGWIIHIQPAFVGATCSCYDIAPTLIQYSGYLNLIS